MANSSQSLTEQRFYAAVNVIRGLPKNGSYQPSHDMQLRFYSYFKQATEGRCNQKKPGIWNPVSRAKWEAWNRLGNMPRDDAMNSYVEELKKIIETMSYTDNVADFMGSISELDGVSVEDLEAVAPEAIQKVRSQPNSPFASREASPVRAPYMNGHSSHLTNGHNGQTNGVLSEALAVMNGNGNGENGYHNGHLTDHSDDEYIDTIDDYDVSSVHSDSTAAARSAANESGAAPQVVNHTSRTKSRHHQSSTASSSNHQMGGEKTRAVSVAPSATSLEVDLRFHSVLSQLNLTVESMNMDIQRVMARMMVMEKSINEMSKSKSALTRRRGPKWWPFKELSPNWVIFIVVWPFVAHRLMRMMSKRK